MLPGFRVSEVKTQRDKSGNTVGVSIRQQPERGDAFVVPQGHAIKGVSALLDPEGREVVKWVKTREEPAAAQAWREALDEFKRDIPRAEPVPAPALVNANLCAQYTLTDLHMNMLADAEENGDSDYSLEIAEKLIYDWFATAVSLAPQAHTAVFAQIGDMFHFDSMEAVTPAHRHLLDASARPHRMVRAGIRLINRITSLLLQKHQHVHVIIAKANHDPYSSVWLRETFADKYENEPRLTVDTSAREYYAYEFGNVALFYHHGHKRGIGNIDAVFVGMFREMFGRCAYSYGHIGHLHNDEVKETPLMKIERHRTLAPADAYAAGGGYLSKRDGKVIVYHRDFGEVSRLIISPQMIAASHEAA